MTREEIYDALYSHDEVYRPPLERGSALLEVTYGCSYGKCCFCDFCRDSFQVISLTEVEQKSRLLSQIIGENPSLHLLGCNPLCLSTAHLLQILGIIQRNLPSVNRVSMYARAEDVIHKGEADLRLLQAAGLRDLHIGLESGSDTVLQIQNKGETIAQMMEAFEILHHCKIQYHLTLIPGLGGTEYSQEHSVMTAALLSQLYPSSIWCMALKIWPGTQLNNMVMQGDFHPLTYQEILLEEREMIRKTQLHYPCLYVDSTVLGKYTIMGVLPEGKQKLLERIDFLLNQEREQII